MNTSSEVRGLAPVFLVKDVVRAHDYYADKLGFRADRLWGDPPNFCIAARDGMSVMLDQVCSTSGIEPNGRLNRWDAYFWVTDADALHAEFSASGADIVCVPEDKFYGIRDFMVRDLDGHLLAFGHATE